MTEPVEVTSDDSKLTAALSEVIRVALDGDNVGEALTESPAIAAHIVDVLLDEGNPDLKLVSKMIMLRPDTARALALHDGKRFLKNVGTFDYEDQLSILDDDELCVGSNSEVMEDGVFELIESWDPKKSAEKVGAHLKSLETREPHGYITGDQEMLLHLGVLFNSEEPEHRDLLCEALKMEDVIWGQLDRGYDHRIAEWIESFPHTDQQEIVDEPVARQLQRGFGWTGLENALVPE